MRVAGALVLLFAACGDNIGGIEIEDYAAASRDAECRYLVHCGLLPDFVTCATTNLGRYHVSDAFVAAVHAGSIVWHPEVAYECLQQAEHLSCDTADAAHLYSCAPLWEGTLSDGATCTLPHECISNECWIEPCVGACCVGYCVGNTAPEPAHLGEACRLAPCIEGYCNASICIASLPAGSTCTQDEECERGLACASSTCQQLPDTGESCTTRCRRDGDACNYSTYRCEPSGLLGAGCTQGRDCSPFYQCDTSTSGRCQPLVRPVGAPCTFGALCSEPDTFCDWDTRRCSSPKPDGESCVSGANCESWVCDNGICAHCAPD